MKCAFCYIPFDNGLSNEQTARSIVDKLALWNLTGITFGGGDPLVYKWGPALVDYARWRLGQDVFIQLDTNGLLFPQGPDQERLLNAIDLLGLPLDGVSSEACKAMRSDSEHAERVLALIGDIGEGETKIKINTVVSKKNIQELDQIGLAISHYQSVKLWSLYEFWAIGTRARLARKEFCIDSRSYNRKIDHLIRKFPNLVQTRDGATADRKQAYFFVNQEGRCYTVSGEDSHAYVELGSIFASDPTNKWAQHVDKTAHRQRIERRIDAIA